MAANGVTRSHRACLEDIVVLTPAGEARAVNDAASKRMPAGMAQ